MVGRASCAVRPPNHWASEKLYQRTTIGRRGQEHRDLEPRRHGAHGKSSWWFELTARGESV